MGWRARSTNPLPDAITRLGPNMEKPCLRSDTGSVQTDSGGRPCSDAPMRMGYSQGKGMPDWSDLTDSSGTCHFVDDGNATRCVKPAFEHHECCSRTMGTGTMMKDLRGSGRFIASRIAFIDSQASRQPHSGGAAPRPNSFPRWGLAGPAVFGPGSSPLPLG